MVFLRNCSSGFARKFPGNQLFSSFSLRDSLEEQKSGTVPVDSGQLEPMGTGLE